MARRFRRARVGGAAALAVALAVATSCLVIPPAAAQALLDPYPDIGPVERALHMHDPSRVITHQGRQIVAITGKEQTPAYACGLEIWARDAQPRAPWRPADCLLTEKPAWVAEELPDNDGAYWAPAFVDAHTLIYSAASDFESGEASCLGAARRGADGVWRDLGHPLVCHTNIPEAPESSVIDPAIFHDQDGTTRLVTGGGVIRTAVLDLDSDEFGLDWDLDSPDWTSLARGPREEPGGEHLWVEAAYLHAHAGSYYLFVNWGACCSGAASTYEIRVGRAASPLGPFVDRDGVAMLDGGGMRVLASQDWMAGPGHASIRATRDADILSFHYYDARRDGLPWLGEVALDWVDGWPHVRASPTP